MFIIDIEKKLRHIEHTISDKEINFIIRKDNKVINTIQVRENEYIVNGQKFKYKSNSIDEKIKEIERRI